MAWDRSEFLGQGIGAMAAPAEGLTIVNRFGGSYVLSKLDSQTPLLVLTAEVFSRTVEGAKPDDSELFLAMLEASQPSFDEAPREAREGIVGDLEDSIWHAHQRPLQEFVFTHRQTTYLNLLRAAEQRGAFEVSKYSGRIALQIAS
jgi:hypothetical protein